MIFYQNNTVNTVQTYKLQCLESDGEIFHQNCFNQLLRKIIDEKRNQLSPEFFFLDSQTRPFTRARCKELLNLLNMLLSKKNVV